MQSTLGPYEDVASIANNIIPKLRSSQCPSDEPTEAVNAVEDSLPFASEIEPKQADYFAAAASTTTVEVRSNNAVGYGNVDGQALSDKSTVIGPAAANIYHGANLSGNSRGHLGNNIIYNIHPRGNSPEKLENAIRALGQHDPKYDRAPLARKPERADGTFQWVLDLPMFKKWRNGEDTDHSLIWIRAKRGMGKTALTVVITTLLEQSSPNKDNVWVLYYFCDKRDKDRNSVVLLLRGFIWQLLRLSNRQQDLAARYYNEFYCQGSQSYLSCLDALWDTFRGMIDACPVRRIFCIIDGLDQCYEETTDSLDRAKSLETLDNFLEILNEFFTGRAAQQASTMQERAQSEHSTQPLQTEAGSAKLCDVRMLILSREVPDCIAKKLGPRPSISLDRGANQNIEDDFQRVVLDNVRRASTSCQGSRKSRKERTETIAKILNDGESRSLLWVSLMADKLTNMEQGSMKKYVKHVPSSVEAMHVQTLLDIPSRQTRHISAILKWVALAARPLSTLELTKAVKYYLKSSFSKKKLGDSLKLCHPMVCEQEDDKGKTIVMLAHQSALELLVREDSPVRQDPKLQDFVLDKATTHSELANTCIAYLQKSTHFKKSRRVRLNREDALKNKNAKFFTKHPFLEYAIAFWTFHAKYGNIEKTHYSGKFFEEGSMRRKLWWESYFISLRHSFAWKWTTPGNFSLLHLAAFFDIVPLAQFVEKKGLVQELLSAEDHQGLKPINWATERSQAAMVRFLLQHGDFDNGALLQAARTGDAVIIKMLLENRKEMQRSSRTGSESSSPAFITSPVQSFRKVTLSSISEWAKKRDETDKKSPTPLSPQACGYGKLKTETPLHIAATCGHDQAVKALLDAGEDVHETTDGGWTALHNAAWFGRTPVVERLIAAGANPMARTKEHLTPLHCAVKNLEPDVVVCLLSKYASDGSLATTYRKDVHNTVNIEAEDQFGFTPFHMACHTNSVNMIATLAGFGADIERRTKQGWTPLLWACINGKYAIVESLLKLGADVDARWNGRHFGEADDIGPVGLAKAYGHEEIARLVRMQGASDTNRLTADETEALPQAAMAEQSYDVPMVEDVVAIKRQDTGVSLGTDDDESSADSDDQSDDLESDEGDSDTDDSANGSEAGDGGHDSRKQSATSIPEGWPQSNHSLLGLGIHEDISTGVEEHEMRDEKVRLNQDGMGVPGHVDGATDRDATGADLQKYENPVTSEETDTAASLTGVATEPVDAPANKTVAGKRSISTPDISASLKDKFSRFSTRMGPKRTASANSETTIASFETAKESEDSFGEQKETLHGDPEPTVNLLKVNTRVFGRLGSFGRKNSSSSNSSEIQMTQSPAAEDISDPNSKTESTADTSVEVNISTPNGSPSSTDDHIDKDNATSQDEDQKWKSPSFNTRNLFRWKTSSSNKDTLATVPEDAVGPTAEDVKQNEPTGRGGTRDEHFN